MWGYYCSEASPSKCETKCSDSIIAGTEECDDGNAVDGDECTKECKIS